MNKIRHWFLNHKKTSIFILLVLAFFGYRLTRTSNGAAPQYVTTQVQRGTLVSSVTGTGQVSASNQVEVISEVTGNVISVPATMGQKVKKGQLLASLDSMDAARAVEDAQLSLENAKLSYQKSLKQSQDQAVGSSVSDLEKAYDDGFTAVANAFIDMPDIIQGMNDLFYNPSHSPYFTDLQLNNINQTAIDYKYEAGRTFDQAKKDYDANFSAYKSLNANQHPEQIKALLQQTYNTVKELSLAATGAYNTIDYVKGRMTLNIPTQITTDKNDLNSYITKLNDHMTKLSNAVTAIENAKDSATTATLDLKSAELNVSKAEASLRDSQTALADHRIGSPFDGIVAKVDVEPGDKINANASIATLITDQKVAEVSLNEVDVAKVKVGQKATLTFDAIDGLSITGEVTEVDLLGTVEQGVVSYTVKIAFDVNDDRVKPGMSLSAAITTDTKPDVLMVPNASVKSQNNQNYVQILNASSSQPVQVPVEIGVSNDQYTEIVSGLSEGENVVSKTITPSANSATSQAPSLFGGARGTGGNRTGGGNVRIGG